MIPPGERVGEERGERGAMPPCCEEAIRAGHVELEQFKTVSTTGNSTTGNGTTGNGTSGNRTGCSSSNQTSTRTAPGAYTKADSSSLGFGGGPVLISVVIITGLILILSLIHI